MNARRLQIAARLFRLTFVPSYKLYTSIMHQDRRGISSKSLSMCGWHNEILSALVEKGQELDGSLPKATSPWYFLSSKCKADNLLDATV